MTKAEALVVALKEAGVEGVTLNDVGQTQYVEVPAASGDEVNFEFNTEDDELREVWVDDDC